jgi:hypothetical protein
LDDNSSLFQNPKHFTPEPGCDTSLDLYCDFMTNVSNNLDQIPKDNRKDNLTKYERSALQEFRVLVESQTLVILEADKGRAVVILDAQHYKKMVEDVFLDSKYFEPVDDSQTKEILAQIVQFCHKHKSCFTLDEIAFVTQFDARESNFHGLPKAHKSDKIKNAILNQNK